MPPKHITVLGGGLTGLTAAYRLATALPDSKIVLLESSSRLGGWIRSERHKISRKSIADSPSSDVGAQDAWATLESGPRTIRPRGSRGAAGMLRLIRDLGLESELLPISKSHPSAKNRFLLDPSSHRLTKLPSSVSAVLGKQPSLLKGFLRSILTEPFRSRSTGIDESVDTFFRRRLGNVVADNLASAMVHGIYAADSRELSVRSTFEVLWEAEKQWGSVILGMIGGTKSRAEKAKEKAEWDELGQLGKDRLEWSLYGIRGGLETLVKRLNQTLEEKGVDIQLNHAVKSIDTDQSGIRLQSELGVIQTDHIISALSPSTLQQYIPTLPHLNQQRTSVGVINIVYPLPSNDIHPPGFGYLVPRCHWTSNKEGVIGVIFDSTALPMGDEDPRVTKLTIMMGGPWWSSYPGPSGSFPMKRPIYPEDLVAPALKHLVRVFPQLKGVTPSLVLPKIHTDCIPTYTIGHADRMRELYDAIQRSPWKGKLSLAGNGYGGVGVNDCVFSAEEIVRGLAQGREVTGLERWSGESTASSMSSSIIAPTV